MFRPVQQRETKMGAGHLAAIGSLLFILVFALTIPTKISAGPFDGTIWAALGGQEQDKVLQTLANELEAVRAGRAAQAAADEQAAKTLNQLLDELYAPQTESAWRGYSKKYAGMALQAFRADAAKFASMAGSASAGDFDALTNELPRIGASVFASLVGDALEARGMDDTKVVWEALVSRAGNLQEIGVSVMRGDTVQALELAKTQAKGELEAFSKNTVAGVIDWAFSTVGAAPGQAYLQVIASEQEFIAWSKKTMANWFIKDCLDAYAATHKATNGRTDAALDEFELCALLGGNASAMREFKILLSPVAVDADDVVPLMLEAYRASGTMPHQFITDFVAQKIAAKERMLAAELAAAQAEVEASSTVFSRALGQRLAALAQAALGEDGLSALLEEARKALGDSKRDLDAVGRASEAAIAACGDYRSAKANAERLRSEGQKLDGLAFDVRSAAHSVTDCGDDSTLTADLAEAQRLKAAFDAALADVQVGLNAVCTAREGIGLAPDQQSARQLVQEARDGAAKTAAAIETAQQAYAAFTPILENTAATSGRPSDGAVDVARMYLSQMDAALAALKSSDGPGLATDFAAAKAAMQDAQRRASNLATHAEEREALVLATLEPHKAGPLRDEIEQVIEGLKATLSPAQDCADEIVGDWNGSRGWSNKTFSDLPDLAELEALANETHKRCPIAVDVAAGSTPEQDIAAVFTEVDAGTVLLDIAQRGYERCFAEALVAYSDKWGSGATPTPNGDTSPPDGTTGADPANDAITPPAVSLRESILIVLDASGSMNNQNRIERARASATAMLQGVPVDGDVEVGLMVFYDCSTIRLEVPFTTDPNQIIGLLPSIRPSGSTPLAAATAKGKAYMRSEARGARKRFILLTDGEESCGGDPVAAMGQ